MAKKLLSLSCIIFFFIFSSFVLHAADNPDKGKPLRDYLTDGEMYRVISSLKWWIMPVNSAYPDFSLQDFYLENRSVDTIKKGKITAFKTAEDKKAKALLSKFGRLSPSGNRTAYINEGAELKKKDGKYYLRFSYPESAQAGVIDTIRCVSGPVLITGPNSKLVDLYWLDENRLVIGGYSIISGDKGEAIQLDLYLYDMVSKKLVHFSHDRDIPRVSWEKLPYSWYGQKYFTLAREGVDVKHTGDYEY